jgi:hypothetical protein
MVFWHLLVSGTIQPRDPLRDGFRFFTVTHSAMVKRGLRRTRNASYIGAPSFKSWGLLDVPRAQTMRYAMSDQTSNRNDAADRKFHIHEDVMAVIFGLTPVIIVFYLLTVN